MLSPENTFAAVELVNFEERLFRFLQNKKQIASPIRPSPSSTDWPSNSSTKRGLFANGSTRGDGLVGEEITRNLKTTPTIPCGFRLGDGGCLLHFRIAYDY
jgi:DNA ligase (NAD+)